MSIWIPQRNKIVVNGFKVAYLHILDKDGQVIITPKANTERKEITFVQRYYRYTNTETHIKQKYI